MKSIYIWGGDWENSDALKYSEHEPLFELIKNIYIDHLN